MLGAVLLTVGRSYVGNDVTHSTLLDRACACSYENLPKYRSYRVSNTAPWCLRFDVTSPYVCLRDRDGVQDDLDNCPDIPNAAQEDNDADGVGMYPGGTLRGKLGVRNTVSYLILNNLRPLYHCSMGYTLPRMT